MGIRSSEAIGRRIKQAREDAGRTQESLAQSVHLDRSALAKIETGTRKISALELARIAENLAVRLEWFVADAPPALVSRRNTREPGAPSPTMDALAERVAREVEFVQVHDETLRYQQTPEALRRPTTRAEVETAAGLARELLGVDPAEPVTHLSRRVARTGLLAFSIDLGADAADGCAVLLAHGGVAIVNGHLRVGRRRLTLAHELGHYLFADAFALDWQVTGSEPASSREGKIDHFARCLLLSEDALTRAWADHRRDERPLRASAVLTASRFRVDMSTLARRLSELDLVSNGEAGDVRRLQTTRADIVDLDLVVSDELEAPELARPYVEAVLRLYRQEIVSEARALDLLFDTWNEVDLPERPSLPQEAIWSFVS